MFLISQILLFLVLAFLIGALVAWLLGLCNCRNQADEGELSALRSERDDLAARLAAAAAGAAAGAGATSAADAQRIARLEAELAEARVAAAAVPAPEPAAGEDTTALRWRNRYLEARVRFLEEAAAAAPAGPPAATSGEIPAAVPLVAAGALAAGAAGAGRAGPGRKSRAAAPARAAYTMSEAGNLSPEALEAAVLAAGAGRKPRAARAGSTADELLDIIGVGPKNKAWLNEQGIHTFRQIAQMEVPELAWLAANLPTFGTRVYRENWVAQCDRLMRGLPPKDGG